MAGSVPSLNQLALIIMAASKIDLERAFPDKEMIAATADVIMAAYSAVSLDCTVEVARAMEARLYPSILARAVRLEV